jgi:mycothiol system anti-sigma-R factor
MDSSKPQRSECEEAIHKIYHFMDGLLDEEKRKQIAKHLDDCKPCGKAFDFEQEIRKVIADKCKDVVPESLREKIAEAIKHDYK